MRPSLFNAPPRRPAGQIIVILGSRPGSCMGYRNSSQIIAALLTATEESGRAGIAPTPLLTKANITHSRLRTLTANLTSSGLISRITYDGRNAYVITPRGREYLEKYKEFHAFAESFGLDL